MSDKKRIITAEDLYKFELVSVPQISPNGEYVVYAQQRVDRKSEKKYSNLWVSSTGNGHPGQFTHGDQTDNTPKWSPDGLQIAFTSNRGDKKQPQFYMIPFKGGEARPLTDLKGEFGAYEWSPDGTKLAFQFRKKDAEVIEREEDEAKQKLGIVQRHYDRAFYKFDGYGFLPKERWHIWTVDTATGEAQQITDSDIFDELLPSWSPDGEWITFISNRNEKPDLHYNDHDIFVIPAEGGDIRKLETPPGFKQFPTFSPDGKWIAYYGREGLRDLWKNVDIWIAPFETDDGTSAVRNLTADHPFTVEQSAVNDLNFNAAVLTAPVWSPDGRRIYFPTAKHGSQLLMSVDVDNSNLNRWIDEKGVVGGFSFDHDQKHLAYFWGSMKDPGQVSVHNLEDGETRQITRTNAWLDDVDLGEVEEVWFKGSDDNDLQGWILKPPGFDSSQTYPSILEIHGGPLAQYGEFFMHEFYYLAARGYVVFFSNPRGGQGYGEEHAKTIWEGQGGWGDTDYADLMLWVDHMTAQPYIDPERMGVTGGSYGGFMTLWIIGHTHQFKSAVAQRVVSNWVNMWGSSDMNWVFQKWLGDMPPWKDMDNMWKQSPMAHIGSAQTPTLIIHSEHDHRCPIEQGEQAFVALQTNGVDSEMVRFPVEPHGLSRQGRTDRRIARLNHIGRWMDKYLM